MEKQNLVKDLDNGVMNNLNEQAQAILEERLSFIENAIDESILTVDNIDREEQELKKAMAKIMEAKGLVSANVPLLMMEKETGWREELRKRFVAIINCHKPGSVIRIKTDDLVIDEEKAVKNGNKKTIVKVSRQAAIAKAITGWMANSKDKSERLEDGKVKITEAKDPVNFIIKTPSARKPFLEVLFDMGK